MDRIPMPLAARAARRRAGALRPRRLRRRSQSALGAGAARCSPPTCSGGASGRATRCVGVLGGRRRDRRRRAAGCTLGGVQLGARPCRCSPTPEFSWRATVEPGAAAVRRHDGVAEPARRRRDPRRRLRDADLEDHHPDRRRHAGAGAVRRLRAQPGGDHRGDLHGPRGARRPGAALRRRRGLRRDLLRRRPVRRGGRRRCWRRSRASWWSPSPAWRCSAPSAAAWPRR